MENTQNTQTKGSYTYFTDTGLEFTLEIPIFWETIYKGKPRERLYEEIHQMLNIVKTISKDKVIVDVGVNFGLFSVPVSLSGYKIVGFEPVKSNFDSSVLNMAKNNCKDFHLYNYALSSETKEAIIYIPECPDNASLNKNAAVANMIRKGYQEENIKCIKFDDWITQHTEFNNIGFIKIDCQGEDYNVTLGMSEFLKQAKDIYIVIEYERHLITAGHTYEELDNLLFSLGFKYIRNISATDKLWHKQ